MFRAVGRHSKFFQSIYQDKTSPEPPQVVGKRSRTLTFSVQQKKQTALLEAVPQVHFLNHSKIILEHMWKSIFS